MINVNFQIPKQRDREIIVSVLKAFESSVYEIKTCELTTIIGPPTIKVTPDTFENNPIVTEVLDKNSELINVFTFFFPNPLSVVITRQPKEPLDNVVINLNLIPNQPQLSSLSFKQEELIGFVSILKEDLNALDLKRSLVSTLSAEAQKQYELREVELVRMENLVAKITKDLSKHHSELDKRHHERTVGLDETYTNKRKTLDDDEKQLRNDLREELSNQREFLEDEFINKKSILDKTHRERLDNIDEKQRVLEEREKLLDDRDSKHARRQIRKEIKKIIEDRNKEFSLTKGTNKKRLPIHIITISILVLIGFALYQTSTPIPSLLKDSENVPIWLMLFAMIKPFTLAALMTTLSVFYIRWINQWFQQHAKEEFKLKRFDLDVDRASWIFEMVMEWQEEKGKEISPELISKLTNNLFVEEGQKNVQLHPADKLVSSLFGSSSEATINLPGVGELKMNRKGIKKLLDSELEMDENK